MGDVGLITTEYGLREIPRQSLYGRSAPNPKEYAELDRALKRYQAQHPGLVVLRDDLSALSGGMVLVWMPETLFREYRDRRQAKSRHYTVRQFFADLDAEREKLMQVHRDIEQARMREITGSSVDSGIERRSTEHDHD
jgi:hypothetical protein